MSSYELLTPGQSCGKVLPLNALQDAFTFLRFASLEVVNDGGTKDVVLPRDTVAPETMQNVLEDVQKELPYKVPLPELRGGLSLTPRFNDWRFPLGSEGIKTVEISDPRELLGNPTITVDGAEHKVELTAPQLDELLSRDSTIVNIGSGLDRTGVQLRLRRGNDRTDSPARVDVGNVGSFLRDPHVTLSADERYRVDLDNQAIGELLSTGVARVTLSAGDRTRSAYLVANRTASPSGEPGAGVGDMGGTGSASYAVRSRVEGESHPPMGTHMTHSRQPHAPAAATLTRVVQQAAGGALPKLDIMLALPYSQTWELLGYSRGELVNTIALGPQEETTIEVFTWDRRRRESEQSSGLEQEGLMEASFTDKNTMDVVKEMTSASDWHWNAGGGVTIPVKVPIQLNAGYNAGGSLNTADRMTRQAIQEATRKASSRIKATRQTKVSESEEIGREERVTRRIRNANMCRTLSLDFFEVLSTYQVTTTLMRDQVRLCVAVPGILSDEIDRRFLLTWEGVLSAGLLSSKHIGGFKAARTLAAADELCARSCNPACTCRTEQVTEEPPRTVSSEPSAVDQELARRAQRVLRAAKALRETLTALTTAGKEPLCGISYLSGINPFKSEAEQQADELRWSTAKAEYHRWLYWKFGTGNNPTLAVAASAYLGMEIDTAEKAAEALDAFVSKADRSVFDTIVAWLKDVLFFPITQWKLMLETLLTGHVCLPRLAVEIGLDSAGLPGAMEEGRNAVAAYRQPPPTPTDDEKEEEKKKEEVKAVAGHSFTTTELAEQAAAAVDEKALVWHIQANESYYRQLIWRSLDPNDRVRLLSLYGELPLHVMPEVLGFLGSAAILPYRTDRDDDAAKWLQANVFDNAVLEQPSAPVPVTIPTRGIVTETRLGSCDGCEDYIIQHRALDLRLKEAEVRAAEQRALQEELETQRYQQRLAASMFDDPDPNSSQSPVRIAIRQEKPATP